MTKSKFLMALGGLLLATALAQGQLRIVTLNASNSSSAATAGPRNPWMSTILTAIGTSMSDDPTMAGNTGIAKPVDILCLQEVWSGSNLTSPAYASLLNTLYPGSNYQYSSLIGATYGPAGSDGGTQGVVYNADAVTLVGEALVGVSSGTGQLRQAMRYQFRPVGYDSSTDFYVYNAHFKSDQGTTERNQRNIEATAIRADADALGSNKNVLYLGDFNIYTATEPAYQTLISAGSAQAIDPISQAGAWNNNAAFKSVHSQNPYNSTTATTLGTGFTIPGSAGGVDDRFDQQLITANLNDGEGVAYIANSYQAFGNNGTHTETDMNQPINTATNTAQPANVLDALAGILDHLPVVADYQLPAKMSVNVASLPSTVIVGASVPANVTVSNTAPVSLAIGADELDYNVSSSGSLSGSAAGVATATLAGNMHALSMNTVTPGIKSGTVSVSSSSQSAANASFSQNVSTTVLAHATPSFDDDASQTALTLDFGIRARGSAADALAFDLFNRADISGFTAGLDLDAIVPGGDSATLTTTLATYLNQDAGTGSGFEASLDTTSTGTFAATYTLDFSDQDLPGAAALSSLTLTINAIVAIAGDANLDGMVTISDLGDLASNWQSAGGWHEGDFNGDGLISISDLGDLASNWQAGVSEPLSMSFAEAIAAVGLGGANVPEPAAGAVVLLLVLSAARKRRAYGR